MSSVLGKRSWEPGGPPAGGGEEEAALSAELAWLHSQIPTLQKQLSTLQQQHMALSSGGPMPPPLSVVKAPHDPAWTEQTNPENGMTYYWNSRTGESVYERPADYNPPLPNRKGPVGANLFVVRKMRRGDFDTFTDVDLRAECSKYGTVLRAEMTVDKATGMSKGFGFVSLSTVEEADAAIAGLNGAWVAGREMRVEKTKEDGG